MFLHKLELQGFKSFANKISLEFTPSKENKGITAIVGPNGSGKSNLADAIRWVLGEQSMKHLRGKKTGDVIFSGSDKKAQLGFTEVSLCLNNEEKTMSLDYPEIVITRRLYKSGESEYLINKNKTRLQDIILLLAKANFGQRTYSIIGQGMIDAFLLSSPSERKELFEEAAGVRHYQIKKDQSLNKLAGGKKNLEQAEILLQEITPRLKSLTRQAHKLEKREELEKELKEKQEQYYGQLFQEITLKVKTIKEKKEITDKEREKAEKELNILNLELNSLEKEKPASQIFSEFQKEYEKLLEKKNDLKEKEIIIKNKINFEIRSSSKSSISLEEVLSQLDYLLKLQNDFFDKIREIKELKELNHLKEEARQLKNKFTQFIENAKGSKMVQKSGLREDLEDLEKKIQEINKELSQIQEKISSFNKKEEKKRGQFFDLQRKIQKEQSYLNQIIGQLNEINIDLTREETRRDDLEREIKEETGSLPDFKTAKAQTNIQELRPEIQKLKYQLELIGGIDPEIIQEYKETKERYEFLYNQSEDLKKAIKSLEEIIQNLDENIKKQFNASFVQISEGFEKYFKVLFGGGKANLILQKTEIKENEEENKILSEGVEIQATPPGKRLKNINMLSGGERALTSIALICAILSSNPSPFVVLDEVDAALDEANSIKFAQILADLSHKTQFIIITHNRATMARAKTLYGITMGNDGVSKILSLKLEDIKE